MGTLLQLIIAALVVAIPLAWYYQRRTGLSFWRHYFYASLMLIGLALLVAVAISGGKK